MESNRNGNAIYAVATLMRPLAFSIGRYKKGEITCREGTKVYMFSVQCRGGNSSRADNLKSRTEAVK